MKWPLVWSMVCGLSALGAMKAQSQPTEVSMSSYNFSNGVHPTLAVTFQDTRANAVEAHWRDVLKQVSHKVSNRKELTGFTALIPSISQDTMRVLVKAVESKGTGQVVCHVAFFTVVGYVGPDSDPAVLQSAREFVRQHALDLRLALANEAVAEAERHLDQYRRDLVTLRRDHDRAIGQRERNMQKDSIAAQDQARLAEELKAKDTEVAEAQARSGPNASEQEMEELKRLKKEQQKLSSELAAAGRAEANARKRTDNAAQALTRNEKAQADLEVKIQRQEELVEQLRRKQAAIQ